VATGHGAVVAGEVNLNFTHFCQPNQPQLNEGTMPFSFQKPNLDPAPSCDQRLRPAFCRNKRAQGGAGLDPR
jgi:hypothetical protein